MNLRFGVKESIENMLEFEDYREYREEFEQYCAEEKLKIDIKDGIRYYPARAWQEVLGVKITVYEP